MTGKKTYEIAVYKEESNYAYALCTNGMSVLGGHGYRPDNASLYNEYIATIASTQSKNMPDGKQPYLMNKVPEGQVGTPLSATEFSRILGDLHSLISPKDIRVKK